MNCILIIGVVLNTIRRWISWNAFYTSEVAHQHVDNNSPPVVINPVNPTNNVAPKSEHWNELATNAKKTLTAFKDLGTLAQVAIFQEKVKEMDGKIEQVEKDVNQALDVVGQFMTMYVCIRQPFFLLYS